MFSRSEKTEEAADPSAEPKTERSPMVLAALAGLLAIAGAFLLVWYFTNSQDDVADDAVAVEAERQVLVVTEAIPAGTSVRSLLDAPTGFLSARAVPDRFVAADAIHSMEELRELDGRTLASEARPGEQLLSTRFIDRSDFDNENFIDRVSAVSAPEGHHQIVLSLPATRALGGNIRGGDNVTVVSAFRVNPPDGDTFEVSLVVLNTVEVINVQASTEVIGQVSDDAEQLGIATQGSFAITVAVEPNELTDLTYAMQYGTITLAVALPGASNDDPKGPAVRIDEIIGDRVGAERSSSTITADDEEGDETEEALAVDEDNSGDS